MTESAREHLHTMVHLADRLICESLNETNSVEDPERSVSKEEFLEQYLGHSNALCEILDNIDSEGPVDMDPRVLDQEIAQKRQELADAVAILKDKIAKLNDLRFWMDNMINDTNDK